MPYFNILAGDHRYEEIKVTHTISPFFDILMIFVNPVKIFPVIPMMASTRKGLNQYTRECVNKTFLSTVALVKQAT
jgi:hypothetical protein